MIQNLAFLSVQGHGLTIGKEEVCDAIALAASALIISSEKNLKIKGEEFDGRVTNHFRMGAIGALTGMIFSVEMDVNSEHYNGSVKAQFVLVRPITEEELSCGIWF